MDIEIINQITQTVENEFGHLDENQLNRKIIKRSWSIGQCLDHIIVSNEMYFPALENVISGKYRETYWEKNNILTRYTGRRMISTLGPVVEKKYKSPKPFIPKSSEIKPDIIISFKAHQKKLIELFSILETRKYVNQVITSPVASLITLRVGDVIDLIIVHEQRHLNQALTLKKSFDFI